MVRTHHEYDDIPGTFVFDAERAKDGFHLNMFCMSLMKDENRKAFKAGEAKYLDRFPLTQEQRDAILNRDYNRMLELGGNIYFTAKLGATDGHSFQHIAAIMTGSTQEDYAKMMLAGGRHTVSHQSYLTCILEFIQDFTLDFAPNLFEILEAPISKAKCLVSSSFQICLV